MSASEPLKVVHKDKEIEACVDRPNESASGSGRGFALVLTHGSSADMNQKALQSLAGAAKKRGFTVVRFTCKTTNLVYRSKVFRSVLEHVHEKEKLKGYFVGGRAMGSRAALNMANELNAEDGPALKGVVAMSFQLHSEDDKEKLNDDQIKALALPALFITTVNDKTCDKALLEKTLQGKSAVKAEWVEGAEHFRKASGRKETDVFDDVNAAVLGWCESLIDGDAAVQKKEKGAGEEKHRKRKSEDGSKNSAVESKKAKDE